jgi:hypothetical protein
LLSVGAPKIRAEIIVALNGETTPRRRRRLPTRALWSLPLALPLRQPCLGMFRELASGVRFFGATVSDSRRWRRPLGRERVAREDSSLWIIDAFVQYDPRARVFGGVAADCLAAHRARCHARDRQRSARHRNGRCRSYNCRDRHHRMRQ